MGIAQMTATLNGIRATHVRAFLPAWGRWWAEVSLDGEHELKGEARIALADLSLVGTVLSGGPESGRTHLRVVAGKAGWGTSIPARSYANDAAVKASTVLLDAADACGETLLASSLPSSRVGPAWVRPAGTASRALALVAPRAWYVGEDGVTRLGARVAGKLPANVTRSPADLARGRVVLASESIATILPGVVVDTLTAVDVLHELTPEGLRSTVWGARGASSRALAAFAAILEQLDPDRKFRGVTEYRVEGIAGDRVNVTPVRVSSGMPDLARVVARPGLPGCKGVPAVGSRVLVGFADSDPGYPYVAAYENAEGAAYAATSLNLGGTAGSPLAARVGDGVTITSAALNAASSPGTFSTGVVGTISSSSSKARIG